MNTCHSFCFDDLILPNKVEQIAAELALSKIESFNIHPYDALDLIRQEYVEYNIGNFVFGIAYRFLIDMLNEL